MQHDPAERADPVAYWQRRAKAYREMTEAMNTLVTTPTVIRRIAVVRVVYKHYDHEAPEQDMHCYRGQIRGTLRASVRFEIKRRMWGVCQVTDHTLPQHAFDRIQTWEHLIMAQAHRDGRNFHYTKFLMTKDLDRWTHELTGRSV